ncbi:MAG: tetratricopeptide repeat protein [Akkermansiaceae bacterium]
MKILVSILALFATASLALADSNLKQAEQYYQRGLAAEKSGDPNTAIAAYKMALKLHPRHAKARYRAGQVKIHAKDIKADATEAKIGSVIIPVYQLENASFKEAIDLLSLAMDKTTEGKIAPNFVIEDPKNKLKDADISIQLKNVPVKTILNYLHAQTNTKARYDEYAVVIMAR